MLVVPRRVQLTEPEARELMKRLEPLAHERGSANAISRIQYALTDDKEQALTPTEAAAIHSIVAIWLHEDADLEPAARDRLEKLHRATAPI
jgi:hypothetical protein